MPELDRSQRRRRNMALSVVVAAFVISFFQRFAPAGIAQDLATAFGTCLLYTSPSPRDGLLSRMPSSA